MLKVFKKYTYVSRFYGLVKKGIDFFLDWAEKWIGAGKGKGTVVLAGNDYSHYLKNNKKILFIKCY